MRFSGAGCQVLDGALGLVCGSLGLGVPSYKIFVGSARAKVSARTSLRVSCRFKSVSHSLIVCNGWHIEGSTHGKIETLFL